MIPIARTEKLLIQEVGNELIIYDRERNASHCLNPMAAQVWHYCDGQNTIKDIAKLLEKELNQDVDTQQLVWQALKDLERCHLIEEYISQSTNAASISRRKVIKTAVLVGGFAIGSLSPAIRSIIAPTPAMAGSPRGQSQQRSRFSIQP